MAGLRNGHRGPVGDLRRISFVRHQLQGLFRDFPGDLILVFDGKPELLVPGGRPHYLLCQGQGLVGGPVFHRYLGVFGADQRTAADPCDMAIGVHLDHRIRHGLIAAGRGDFFQGIGSGQQALDGQAAVFVHRQGVRGGHCRRRVHRHQLPPLGLAVVVLPDLDFSALLQFAGVQVQHRRGVIQNRLPGLNFQPGFRHRDVPFLVVVGGMVIKMHHMAIFTITAVQVQAALLRPGTILIHEAIGAVIVADNPELLCFAVGFLL